MCFSSPVLFSGVRGPCGVSKAQYPQGGKLGNWPEFWKLVDSVSVVSGRKPQQGVRGVREAEPREEKMNDFGGNRVISGFPPLLSEHKYSNMQSRKPIFMLRVANT